MCNAIDAVLTRAKCLVYDGKRDPESIIRECYDLEVGDWFLWELMQAVFNPSDLLSFDMEEEIIEYLLDECKDEVQDMVDEAEDDEDDEDDECEVIGRIPWHRMSDSSAAEVSKFPPNNALGFRERDVLEHLARVEWCIDNGHVLYRYFHEDGEHDFEWDATDKKVTG